MAKTLSKHLDDDYFDEIAPHLRLLAASLFDEAFQLASLVDESPGLKTTFDQVVTVLPNVLGAELHERLEAKRTAATLREEIVSIFKSVELSIGGVPIKGFAEDGGIDYIPF